MKQLYFSAIFMLLLQTLGFAQERYTLSGYVRDASSGEEMIGANIFVKDDVARGTSTNLYGFYSLNLPVGTYTVVYSYLGYNVQEHLIELSADTRKNIELGEGIQIQEVVVTAEQADENVQSTQMGTVELSMDEVRKLPALLGEIDVLKTIQLLPGVLSAGEGTAGFYVRGGGPDQNLILLDDAVVYNPGHLLGFFSVFNADAIKNTTLIKGGMPARYGGRLSSVVDIQMREGNNRHFEVEGGVGIIASRLTVQGPLQKEKSSFMVSGRRTYAFDIAQPFLVNTNFAGTRYHFYDLNAKANYRFSDKDRLYISAYFGRDVLNFSSAERGFNLFMPWGNSTATLRWNHLFSDKLFMNTSLIFNDYQFEIEGSQDEFLFKLFSGIRDWNVKTDFDYFAAYNHHIRFGVNYTYHTFTPNVASAQANGVNFESGLSTRYAHEYAVYVEDDIKIGTRFGALVGLRASGFTQIGPYTSSIDSIIYAAGEPVKTYTGLEPRLSLRYNLDDKSSLKGGFTLTNQYVHLVTASTSTLPTDVWLPSSDFVRPQRSLQYALGYFRNFSNNRWEASMEVYYRDLFDQIEYSESFVPSFTSNEEEEFVFGRGRAYGAEFFINKKRGKLTGWIGYTLARTERIFEEINDGNPFPATYDRTHDLSVVANYDLNKNWSLGAAFVFGTGNTYTPYESFLFINNRLSTNYGVRNSAREEPYHRIDLSATWTPKPNSEKAWSGNWTFSIYNAYNRKNTFLRYYDPQFDRETGVAEIKAYKVSIFPIIPSITYNFKWNQSKTAAFRSGLE
jgi:outer membrane receptor for ferrienterochelin and colicin